MTKNLDDIRTIVRNRGDFRNTVRFPNSVIDTEIQAAFDEFYAMVVEANEGYYDTSTTTPTVAAQAYVALPSGVWIVRAIDRLNGTEYDPLCRVGVKDRNRYGSTQSEPLAYRLTARGADLYPTPNAIYTLRITYTPVAPTLDSTQREFYNGWEEYAIFGALLRLGGTERNDAPLWQRMLDAAAARVRREAPDRGSSEPEYLNLFGEGDGADWDRPPTWSW